MKHVMLSDAWVFGTDPFPAYRCNLVYGQNKRDREFLPVNDVQPCDFIAITTAERSRELYRGTDRPAAERAMEAYNQEHPEWAPAIVRRSGVLPEGKFCVIKTREKGTILVVPGNDNTNRCLLFVGCAGGFRGGVGVISDGTTGTILKECSAGNNCESSTEVIVILEQGQSVAFHTSGRRTNEVYQYTWNGADLEKKHFSKSEWDNRNVVVAPTIEDAEVL